MWGGNHPPLVVRVTRKGLVVLGLTKQAQRKADTVAERSVSCKNSCHFPDRIHIDYREKNSVLPKVQLIDTKQHHFHRSPHRQP